MFAKTKYKRFVWLLISIGVANGIAEATKQGLSCEKPKPIENADLKPEYDGQSEFNHEAFVEYDCIIGYSIEGTSRKRVCNNGQWSPILFTCHEITCSYVDSPEHGKRLDASNSIGEYTYFKCDTGYKLTGPEKLWCRANGEWLPPDPPTCEPILCPEVPNIRYGRTFQDSSDGMRNDYQSVTKYTCNSGYMLEGNNGQDSRECQADGTWSGEEPECSTPRCKHIGPFYGGDVQYFGDRERWTFAFYRCNEGYHMSPSNVKRSECTDDLEWDPTPPQCFQMAKVYVPENGYYRGNKGNLHHGESYVIQCKNKYEMHSEEGGFINLKSLPIRNNNGSLEPTVPKCLEKRCNPADQNKTIVKYPNGVRVTSKILSQTTVRLECEQGYEYYRDNAPMETSVIRKCVKGNIENAPVCYEARCLVSGYPRNKDTRYRNYRPKYVLDEGQYMRPKNKLEVVCVQEADYELFVNSTGKYLKSFTSDCRFGLFDKEAEEFPICLEKRCNPADQYKTIVKYTNGLHVTSKILSQTTVRLECEQGYDYYRDNVPMKTPVIRKCVKGNIENAPVCEEARCLVSGYPRNKDTRYRNYRTKYVLDEGQYIRPNNKLEVVCSNGTYYELYVNSTATYLESFTSECRYGRLDKELEQFPICLERRCIFKSSQHACFTTNEKEDCISGEFKVPSRTSVTIKCREGYTLYLSKEGTSKHMKDEEQVTCLKGAYFQGYKCIPDRKVQAIKDYFFKIKDKITQGFEKIVDRFTCSSSLFGSNFCEDPCLVPDVQFGFTKNGFGDRVSLEVAHGTQITIGCDNGYDPSENVTSTCKYGDWDIEQFPFCIAKPCHISVNVKTIFWVNSAQLVVGDGIKRTFRNGTKIEMSCANDYEMKDSSTGKTINESRKDIFCILGNWSQSYTCTAAQCSVPQVKNAVLKTKSADKYDHWSKIRFRCNGGHHFSEKYPNNIKREFKAQCRFGNWSRSIPAKCRPDSCQLKNHEGSNYYYNSDLINTTRRFPHGTHVTLQCLDNFDTFDEEGNNIDIYPNVTCYQGIWKNMYTCKKRCNTPSSRNGENMYKVKNISTDQAVLHGERIMVSCAEYQENDFELKCDNGEWKGYVDCNDKKNITNAGDILEHVDGCLLPSDKKFSFRDDNDNDVPVGSLVESGTTLTVTCANIDYYELLTSYDYYDEGTNETTITCTGEKLSHFDLDCPDVEPDSCLELHNGIVKKVFNKYYVSCEEGFSLNLIKQENAECNCQNGSLESIIGHQDPKCIPNDCVLPYDIDDKLSVKDKSRYISLSPGSTVTSGDHVFLNCSKVSEHIYEPLNRRFKCVEGQWIEDEKDPNWKFGNNGTFPKCREAICEPNCANDGMCYKDDHCKCKRLTEGKRCEIVRCDEQCIENGGECVVAGKCICPKGWYGPSCEKKSCILPENSAKPKEPRIMYNIGDTLNDLECEFGYILDSKDSMTCQEDGSWSNIVHCVQSVVYLISVKTGVTSWTKGAGTDAEVYIYLHGRSGKTNKINLKGDFENDDLDETRVKEKDIRPITGITIGHDGAGFKPDWFLKFVSIYVESMNEYYVFRYHDSVWVTANKDITLPLEGNCVNTFDEGHDWNPRWESMHGRGYFIGRYSGMTLRACQQKCTELINFRCISVLYERLDNTCWGFSVAHEMYFHTNRKNWDSLVYRRSCKENI